MASTTTGRRAMPYRRRRAEEPEAEQQTTVEAYRVTPRLRHRVALLGTLVLIGFAALLLRLWALQVLAGSHYAAQAQLNQVRSVRVEAPRGLIVDRNGNPLVTNDPVTAIDLSPAAMPKSYADRAAEVRRLAHVARVSVRSVTKLILASKARGDLIDPIVIRSKVPKAMAAYLNERSEEFPGVTLPQSYVRGYPHGRLAAQLLGYDGQNAQSAGNVVGVTGIEKALDMYLRGVPGAARVRVDSLGHPLSTRTLTVEPQQGQTVQLTINAKLQIAAQNAITYGVQLAHNNKNWYADGGAIVALDPRNGSILALASSPAYNPSVYSGRVTNHALAREGLSPGTALAHNFPAVDRAVAGQYPPGSTFKPLTAIAGLEEGLIKPYKLYPCTGTYKAWEDASHRIWHNWDLNVDQGMDLPTAIARSCDTYFYALGNSFYLLPKGRGQPLQKWARRFGFGKVSGSDVGAQEAGVVPTIGWKERMYTKKVDSNWRIDRLWTPGDSLNLSIGQGNLLVTPLQMARFYAAIANGGKLVTPHVLMDVRNPNGTIVPTAAPPAPRPVKGLNPAYLKVVQQGLVMGTHDWQGTSYGVFGQFPFSIAGKTGTAQKEITLPNYKGEQDQSWWCGYGPSTDAKIVVCAVIENGGEGGAAAAPAAERVFAKFFHVQPTQLGYIHSD